MNEFDKVFVLGKLARDLSGIIVKIDGECVWLKCDAFENMVRALGISDFKYVWYGTCMKQSFIKNEIEVYTLYSQHEDGYIPKPAVPDEEYKAVM